MSQWIRWDRVDGGWSWGFWKIEKSASRRHDLFFRGQLIHSCELVREAKHVAIRYAAGLDGSRLMWVGNSEDDVGGTS